VVRLGAGRPASLHARNFPLALIRSAPQH